jgi:hypothetical protein
MIELLGFVGKSNVSPPVGVDNFFFFDGPTPPTLTLTLGGSAAFESTPTIDGKTASFTTTADTLKVTFGTPLNLSTSDWTLEWSIINQAVPAADYAAELGLFPANGGVAGLQARYGSPGFGNRLQFGGRMAALETCYSSQYTKSGLVGVLKRFALVSKNKSITLYVNGVRENFALGTTNTYNTTAFGLDTDMSAITNLLLGSNPLAGGSVLAKRGPVKLSMFAKYSANYTPVPF